MKKLFLFLSIMFFVSCKSQKQVSDKTVQSIEETYFESWVAGVRGGGAGINFHVNFQKPLSDEIQLEKVLFKGKEAIFYSQDKLHYTANIITRKGGRLAAEEEDNHEPLPESNKAVVYFKEKGKSVIYTITNVKEKELLAYPSMHKPR